MATDMIARGLAARLTSGPNGTIPDKFMPVFPVEGGTTYAVGGIAAGTELNGLTYEQILSMMLYGIVNPTFTAPSLNVTTDHVNAIIGGAADITGTAMFDRGTINPAYGTSGFRAGLPTAYVINGNEIASSALNYSFDVTIDKVVAGDNTVVIGVKYAEGEQPKNSTGGNFGSPLPAGTLERIIKINGTYPIFVTETNEQTQAGNCVEMPIDTVTNTDEFQINVGAEKASTDGKQCFGVSSLMPEIKGIQQYNEAMKTWAWIQGSPERSLTSFSVTTATKMFNGVEVEYKMYTNNLPTMGARKLKIFTVLP